VVPVRFPNIHLNRLRYENGAVQQVKEKAMIKAPLGAFGADPAWGSRLQQDG